MKKTLILDFSDLVKSSLYPQLEEEFSGRPVFQGREIKHTKLRRDIDNFDLPVGSSCFFWCRNESICLAFKVVEYHFVANNDFSKCCTCASLKFSNFTGFNAKEIVDYLEKEWRI